MHWLKISNVGVRVAVVLFSTDALVKLKLNEEETVDGVLHSIDMLPFLGGIEDVSKGLYQTNHVAFRPENEGSPDSDNIVILIMCGRSLMRPLEMRIKLRTPA